MLAVIAAAALTGLIVFQKIKDARNQSQLRIVVPPSTRAGCARAAP